MATNKEAVVEEGKRPKTPTRYPKRMAAYVVAFAVQGTLDDPQRIEQITTNRSADSTNSNKSSESISPTKSTSTKTFTISPSAKLSSVLNIATLSEVKIDIVDENQSGDVTEKKSSQSSSNVVISQETDEHPEIINSAKNIKICKRNNKCSRKKPKKSTMRKVQHSVHFKYKKRKNSIIRRLKKYYENVKLKRETPNSKQIQIQIYFEPSQVVSRSHVLQKLMPKKNSLADAERIPSYEDVNFDYDDDSLSSSPSRSKKSFISYTSQKTLVNKESVPSRNDEEYNSLKTANSVIQVASDKQRYFKSEINNVSLAINESNTHADQVADSSYSNETLMHKENLTSSETFLQNNSTGLTSKPTSSDDPESFEIDYNELNLIQKDKSNATITKTVIPALEKYNEDDSFVTTKLFCDFNKSSITSSCTLQINSGSKENSENVQSNSLINNTFPSDTSKHTSILDKVKSLGFYPTKAPSIDSDPSITCESKNVLFTDNVINSLSFTKDTISCDDHLTDIMKTSVLRKPVEMKNMNYFHNNLVLPNNIAVKAELNAREEIKKSCADNVTNITDMGEVWERVALVLDSAVKRLEETLVERIINIIRESLSIFNQPEYKLTEVHRTATTTVNHERSILTMKNKGIFVKEEHLKLDVDVYVQCDLVQKQVIDQLMFQLSLMPKPIPVSEETFKILKPPELVKDYTEVLKPPAHVTESFSVEEGKGENVTVSTATTELSSTSSFRLLKRLFSCPLGVLRENAVILTSVPTFFIVLFCLYGVIVILMKPW